MNHQYEYYMQKVLNLAIKAKGQTSPNPMVGAIILNENGEFISDGYHLKAGSEHAEIIALKKAGSLAKNGILYVNLEPCCHYGRTPPCTSAIKEAGIKKVIIGSLDPNTKVNGQGVKDLKEAGLEVVFGVLEKECLELNKFFFYWLENQKPWLTLKIAATLNGKIDLGKAGKQITGKAVQEKVHQLRAEHDSILTGSGTILADNPQLNVRFGHNYKNPLKIILDRRLRCEPELKVFNEEALTLLFTSPESLKTNKRQFLNTEIIDWNGELNELLKTLAKKNILSVLMEAGSNLNTAFLEENLVQEIIYFINSRLAPSSLGLPEVYIGNNIQNFKLKSSELIGSDLMLNLDF